MGTGAYLPIAYEFSRSYFGLNENEKKIISIVEYADIIFDFYNKV